MKQAGTGVGLFCIGLFAIKTDLIFQILWICSLDLWVYTWKYSRSGFLRSVAACEYNKDPVHKERELKKKKTKGCLYMLKIFSGLSGWVSLCLLEMCFLWRIPVIASVNSILNALWIHLHSKSLAEQDDNSGFLPYPSTQTSKKQILTYLSIL